MKIEVTANDLKRGSRNTLYGCPIALAMKRITGLRWRITGARADTYKNGWRHIFLPKKCDEWTWLFDKGHPVKPFSFNVPNSIPTAEQ